MEPINRKEQFYDAILTGDTTDLPVPITREETYLKEIAENGGGGTGTTNYNSLNNKPQINGVELRGDKSTEDLIPIGSGLKFNASGELETTGGGGGTDDYDDLDNKPSINNVTLSGNKSLSDLGIDIPSKTSDLTNDSGFITSSDIPTIPSKTSDLTNDSGFITNLVNDLTNYYLKSETYTKAEVNSAIGAITTVHFEAVEQLPVEDIQTNVIYLVPNSSSAQNNVYDEYLYIDNAWEIIGSTQIDLSNYVQKSQTAGLIKNDGTIDTTQYISQHQDITGKADKVSSATNGNFAGLDTNGNLTDSGSKASDFQDADDVMTSADMDEVIDRLPMANSDSIYSLAEQVVGRWIDGKPLYQKTVIVNSNFTSNFIIADDLDVLVSYTGSYEHGNGFQGPSPYVPFTSNINTYQAYAVTGYISAPNTWTPQIGSTVMSDMSELRHTFQYTKTTD